MVFGKKKKKEISLEFSAPQSFAHEGHLSFNAQNKGFEARNLPPELQGVFQELNDLLVQYGLKGISKKEAQYLFQCVGEKMGMSVSDPAKGKNISPANPKAMARATSARPSVGLPSVPSQSFSLAATGRSLSARRNTLEAEKPLSPRKGLALDLSKTASHEHAAQAEEAPLSGRKEKQKKPKKEDFNFQQRMEQLDEEHRVQIEALNAQIKALEAEEQQSLQDWEPLLLSLNDQTSALESQIAAKRSDLEALQAKNASAQATLNQTLAKLASSNAAAEEKLNQKQRLLDAVQQQEHEITAEKELYAKGEEDLATTKQRCKEIVEKQVVLNEQVEKLTQELESQKRIDNQHSTELENKLNDMKAKMQTRISNLEVRLADANQSRATLQAELSTTKNELASKEKFERNFQEEKRQLLANLSRYRDEFKHSDERARAAAEALSKAKAQLETAQASEKTLKEQQSITESENDDLRDKLAELWGAIEVIEKKLLSYRSRSAATSAPVEPTIVLTNGDNAPPPPPPPKTGPPPPPPSKGPSAAKSTPPASSSSNAATGTEGFMSAIRGTTLKKAAEQPKDSAAASAAAAGGKQLPSEGLLGSLAQALLDRRANISEDDDDDDDELLWE